MKRRCNLKTNVFYSTFANIKILPFVLGLFLANKVYTQTFTKVTTGLIVNEANNSYFATWGDYDKDGDLDLFHSLFAPAANNPTGNNFLLQNNCNGAFTKTAKIPTGVVTDGLTGSYSYWIDFDNDNDLDLFVGFNNLYRNNGDGSFTKINNALTVTPTRPWEESSPSFADYDNDGYLDAYTGKHSIYNSNHNGDYTQLDVAPFTTSRVAATAAVAWADYDNDNFMDMYVVNIGTFDSTGTVFLGFGTNYLYHNNGDGTFSEVTSNPSMIESFWSYGCAWADVDNDLDLDLLVEDINSASGRRLYINNGGGSFTKVTTGDIATVYESGQAGFSFADYDNDGDLDLFSPVFGKNLLFDNNGDGTFTNNTSEIISNDLVTTSFGGAWADYDNDGDVDLFVPTGSDDANDLFYINNTVGKNWLKLHLAGVISNKDAIGARVYVKAVINGIPKWQMREINANATRGGESGGTSGHVVHFGINDATIIDSLKIVWPASGITQNFVNVTPNRFIEIIENTNVINDVAACKSDLPITNPGYVSGKMYTDINANCAFDEGIDFPIANKIVKAENGVYFAFTDDNGNYTLNLPAGNYNIKQNPQLEGFDLSPCQIDSVYVTPITSGDTIKNKDFSFQQRVRPCNGTIDLNIEGIAIAQGTCPTGQLQQTPCEGQMYSYCFTITNSSLLPTNANSILSVNLPLGFAIQTVNIQCSGDVIPGSFGNTMNITIPNAIPVGGFCTVCVEVFVGVGAIAPYTITADFNNTVTSPNLIDNGAFDNNVLIPLSTYTHSSVPASGNYWIAPNPNAFNGFWNQTPRSFPNFLYADASPTLGEIVWSQDINVFTNTTYRFNAWFNNIVRITSTFPDPNLEILINNVSMATTGAIPELPNVWINRNFTWCSESQTNALIEIRAVNAGGSGHDFGIDDIDFREARRGGAASLTQTTSCSCDPNDKVVSPMGCGPNGNIGKNEVLTYRIRFENTGTGPAHDILLSDKLDSDLDLSTLQIISASHTITYKQILPDNNLIIKFDGIELPSNILHPDSGRGYLLFKISPKIGLPDGTVITNQTGIYFDQNEVVLTEVTINTLYDTPRPDANFTHKHSCTETGLVYDFNYVGSTPDNATYMWEFQDAMPNTSTEQNPTNVVFNNNSGYKLVSLTVNRNGCSETSIDTIQVVSGLSDNGKKVVICHGGNLITVSTNALASHLAHGDCIGGCNTSNNNRLKNGSILAKNQFNLFDVKLIPNPSSDYCMISLIGVDESENEIKIDLFNSYGQLVAELNKDNSDTKTQQYNFNTKQFANGLYFVKVSYGNSLVAKKLIIAH